MDKKNKNGFLKRKTKAKKNKIGRKKNTLRQAFCGNNIDKKPLKLKENNLFRPFYKTQEQKHMQQKTKPPKNKKNIPKKKKPFCILANSHYFW